MSAVNFSVTRASSKYVLNESGVIEEVLANTPAFEYNIDGSYKGLLVESASENLLLYSEEFDNAAWGATTANITPNTTTSPDGTSNAYTVKNVDDSQLGQFISGTPGVTYTFSIWIKRLVGTGDIQIRDVNNAPTVIDVTSEWQRFQITSTADAGNTIIRAYINVTTTNDSVAVWGAQLEEGGHASSYIPTTITTATRAKDNINLTGASTYIGQTAGTVYLEATIDNIVTNASLITVSDGSDDNIVRITFNVNGDMRMYVKASSSSIINDEETIPAGTYKFAIVYSSGDTRVYRNGVQLQSSATTFTFGATVDEIGVGQVFVPTGQANNWIKAFAFYKRALTDTEAITLTT